MIGDVKKGVGTGFEVRGRTLFCKFCGSAVLRKVKYLSSQVKYVLKYIEILLKYDMN